MRTMFVVAAAAWAIATSAAQAQPGPNCSDAYGNCMTSCASSKQRAGEDRCVEACQMKSNQCYEKAWGTRPATVVTGERPLNAPAAAPTAAAPTAPADALATPEKAPITLPPLPAAEPQDAPAKRKQR